jgi:oligopeptidase A
VPFAEVRAEHVEPAIGELLADARVQLAGVVEPRPRTFENTLLAFENLTERLDFGVGVVEHLEAVATTAELRAAYNAVIGPVSTFSTELLLSRELWQALREYAATEQARGLTGVRARFLRKTLDDFRREGAELGPAEKERLVAINRELEELTTQFGENVLDAVGEFELFTDDPRRLAGLPESAVAAAAADAAARGKKGWRFTLHEPSRLAVLTYADDAELRRAIYLADSTKATQAPRDNRPLIRSILALRREKAALLGYRTFADYVLEDRMAKNGGTAVRFVSELTEKTRPFFERETAELCRFREELEGSGAPAMNPWDVLYYAEKLRQREYDFDEESLRPYFPVDAVLRGLFEIVRRLYGIEVREIERGQGGFPSTWNESVRYFRIFDAGCQPVASFYADFYPRDTKRGGAWMGDLITGGPRPDGFEKHLGYICANVTPPANGKPALLTHQEVETVFHEFGHLLHHSMSRVEIRSLAGAHVAWDFVELPSQFLENWCWEKEALDLFARHHETSEPVPPEMVAKKMAARNFRSASAMMRQLGFAALDLALHTDFDPASGDPLALAREIQGRFSPVPLREDYAMLAGFTHLLSDPVGYAAGYYSYKWAEVLDADAFSRFQREGVFNPETGRAFLESILSQGDSDEPIALFRRFMGRDPDPSALLRRSGLLAA